MAKHQAHIKEYQSTVNELISSAKNSYDLNVRPGGICYLVPAFVNQKRKKKPKPKKLETEVIFHANGQITKKQHYENGITVETWNGQSIVIDTPGYNRSKANNNLKDRGYVLNSRAKAKINNAITHAYNKTAESISKKLRFFTFTIPAQNYLDKLDHFNINPGSEHPDQFYIRKFGQMLNNEMKRTNKLEGYVWTAEKTKQGVIHFHAIFTTSYRNQYARDLSDTWSKYCGFSSTNCVHYGYKRSNKTDAMEQNNFDNGITPESISNYLTKYVSKNQSTIFGRGYGMSRNYTQIERDSKRKIYNAGFKFADTLLNEDSTSKSYIMFDKKQLTEIIDKETGEVYKDYKEQNTLIPATHINTIETTNGQKIYIFKIERAPLLRNFYPEIYKDNHKKIISRNAVNYERNRKFTKSVNKELKSNKKVFVKNNTL